MTFVEFFAFLVEEVGYEPLEVLELEQFAVLLGVQRLLREGNELPTAQDASQAIEAKRKQISLEIECDLKHGKTKESLYDLLVGKLSVSPIQPENLK